MAQGKTVMPNTDKMFGKYSAAQKGCMEKVYFCKLKNERKHEYKFDN